MTPLYFPKATGLAALAELEAVPWGKLAHAHGTGVTGLGVAHDVKAALRALSVDPRQAIDDGLYSCLCQQGLIYESTAYAVPFVAAVVAGRIDTGLRVALVLFLGDIVRSVSCPTVSPRLSEAFTGSVANLKAAAAQVDAQLAELLHALVAATTAPSIEMSAFLDDTFERFEDARGSHS